MAINFAAASTAGLNNPGTEIITLVKDWSGNFINPPSYDKIRAYLRSGEVPMLFVTDEGGESGSLYQLVEYSETGNKIRFSNDKTTIAFSAGASAPVVSDVVPKPLTYDYMPEGYPKKSVLFNIEWDGDTSGLVSAADTYYKVANYTAVTKADLVGCILSLQNNTTHPKPFAVAEDEIYDTQIPHAIMISDYVIFVSEPTSYGPANFTESGVYFVKQGEMYASRLVKQTITPIAEEFLPVTVATTVFHESADTRLHYPDPQAHDVPAQEAFDAFMNTRVFIVRKGGDSFEDKTTYEATGMIWYDNNSTQTDPANVGYVGLKYVYEGASGVGVHTAKAGDASLIPA